MSEANFNLNNTQGIESIFLHEIADIVMGQSPESETYCLLEYGVPFLQGCSEFGNFHPCPEISCNPALRIGQLGSILISVRAPVGAMNTADQDYCIGRGLAAIKAKHGKSDGVFLKHAIENNLSFLHRRSQGSTFLAISSYDLKSFPLPRVTLNQQQKIATILTSIDTAIEKTEALIEKYQQIKSGLMHDLFTRGVLPNGQLRPTREQAPELYCETRIGWIPREWQYELLDRLANRGSGHTPNKSRSEYWNGGIKWISLADSNRLDKLYISDTSYEISQQGIQNSSAVLHPAGVVVLSRDAGIGKSAIITEPMAVSQHFMCWRCEEKIDNHFLYYWLQFNKRTFENIAMGSTILTIGLGYFKKLKIACPTEMDEQKIIAAKLTQLDQYIFRLKDDLMKKQSQKLGLMQDLLTGKVPVTVSENADQEEAHA